MNSIFIFELKLLKGSIIKFSIASVLFSIMYLMFYPIIKDDYDLFMNMLNETIINMMKIGDISRIEEYYRFMIVYVLILSGTQAVYYGLRVFSYDYTNKLSEFIYVKPIKRMDIVMQKMLAHLCGLLIAVFSYIVVITIYLLLSVKELPISEIMTIHYYYLT